jgi:hypothetical protein
MGSFSTASSLGFSVDCCVLPICVRLSVDLVRVMGFAGDAGGGETIGEVAITGSATTGSGLDSTATVSS